jgi:flagellar assembly protein FliH
MMPSVSTSSRASPAAPVITPEIAAAERASLIEEGYARGVEEGMRRGMIAGRSQFTDAIAALTGVMGEMRQASTLAPAVLEENLAALAVIVARQIMSREVSLSRELVADLIRRALTEFPIDQAIRIRVNPLDLSLLTAASTAAEVAPITGTREATWLADPRVVRGGCLIEGRDRIVDGRVDTALERAYLRMSKTDAS